MKSILARYWLAAALVEFAQPVDWRTWADRLIAAHAKPPLWLINMSLAMTLSDLEQAVATALEGLPGVAASFDDVLFGYIWWRFENGEISLAECLKLAANTSDGGAAQIPCESIYELLNKLKLETNYEKVEALAKQMLSPLKHLAEEQWNEIHAQT
jgi:hypothetical protein